MSAPYVYTPQTWQHTPPVAPYYNQLPPSPYASPFIPPSALRSSPNHSPNRSIPGTPRRVRFEDDMQLPEIGTRQRRPSWHGGLSAPDFSSPAGYNSPFIPPTPSSFNRRHSFGNPSQPSWYTGSAQMGSPYLSQSAQILIHPLLNGDTPRHDFHFDLSYPSFSPLRIIAPGQSTLISMTDLRDQATHPPITRLRIICDAIPQWPIEIKQDPSYQTSSNIGGLLSPISPSASPITLGDILVAIHRGLHKQITHVDWARLNSMEETEIARAYSRRCKSVTHPGGAEVEARQGVKRVDYLMSRSTFRGLVRVPGSGDGWETWKMIVG